jgi:hypothetical protein
MNDSRQEDPSIYLSMKPEVRVGEKVAASEVSPRYWRGSPGPAPQIRASGGMIAG